MSKIRKKKLHMVFWVPRKSWEGEGPLRKKVKDLKDLFIKYIAYDAVMQWYCYLSMFFVYDGKKRIGSEESWVHVTVRTWKVKEICVRIEWMVLNVKT
jgi:hypothetical protein